MKILLNFYLILFFIKEFMKNFEKLIRPILLNLAISNLPIFRYHFNFFSFKKLALTFLHRPSPFLVNPAKFLIVPPLFLTISGQYGQVPHRSSIAPHHFWSSSLHWSLVFLAKFALLALTLLLYSITSS